ncbi:MAG: MopE-related protein, partial [Candidatus Aenigmatarchaeota archaeon]
MHKWIIILPILIIFISGCTNIDIESLLKADPTVDSYLNDYPDAELNIKRFDAASIDEFVDQIRNSCDNQAIATQEMYRVLLVSENKDDYVMIWATNTGDFVCVIRTAEQSPGPSDDPDFVCEAGDTILCGSSIGECQEGIRICKDNVWGSCIYSIEPETEVCDELDNDCDGEVNEDDVCTVNGCTEGEIQECGIDTLPCKKGNQTCVDDQWGTCEGSIDPEAETCDDIDNNCDGNIDEGGVCGASCETEWFCVSSTSGSYEAYRMENCSIINNNACEFGCEENRCGAAPLIDTN